MMFFNTQIFMRIAVRYKQIWANLTLNTQIYLRFSNGLQINLCFTK